MRIPLKDIKLYLEEHYKQEDFILSLIKLENAGLVSRTELEVLLHKTLLNIQKNITSVFKKNNIN